MSRSGRGAHLDGVEADRCGRQRTSTGSTELTRRARRALVNALNPPDYSAWDRDWPPLRGVAARRGRAHRRRAGASWGTSTATARVDGPDDGAHPARPNGHKGELRVRMWEEALAAQAEGRVRVDRAAGVRLHRPPGSVGGRACCRSSSSPRSCGAGPSGCSSATRTPRTPGPTCATPVGWRRSSPRTTAPGAGRGTSRAPGTDDASGGQGGRGPGGPQGAGGARRTGSCGAGHGAGSAVPAGAG